MGFASEMKMLKLGHKAAIKLLLQDHKAQTAQRTKAWKLKIRLDKDEDLGEEGRETEEETDHYESQSSISPMKPLHGGKSNNANNASQSTMQSAQSIHSIHSDSDIHESNNAIFSSTRIDGGDDDDESIEELNKQLRDLKAALESLKRKHAEDLKALKQRQNQEIVEAKAKANSEINQIDALHEQQLKESHQSHRQEIKDLISANIREAELDNSIREAEHNMFLERRMLMSVLDTVVDGVISIDSTGVIKRFNSAAEKMFGYSASEILGRKIETLMGEEHAVNHDQYLANYLNTGIKKVIY